MVHGLTSANLGEPDYKKACEQHSAYLTALEQCGVKITLLEADERFPDSVFVEDTAVLAEKCAIVTNPGAPSRQGEEIEIKKILQLFYKKIEHIKVPGSLDGGDVMKVGTHFYVGLSERTNEEGVRQFNEIVDKYGYSCSSMPLNEMLHLKTGVAFLKEKDLVVTGEFIEREEFKDFTKIIVPESESYASNCIMVNGTVIMPAGFPQTQLAIENAGYIVKAVDVSEFRKLDGGVSCLSLRF